jgi:NADH-quinone oxidoreductase subunit E
MHLAQEAYGYMSNEAMQEVAGILDLDPTHVLSLAGFYSLYYEEPVGEYVLEICNDLACALRGADEFVEMASQKLAAAVGETTADGLFTLKTVMCLGACDRAPMLQCNLRFEENLDEAKFEALIARLREEAALKSVDQVDSERSEQAGSTNGSVVERIAAYAVPRFSEATLRVAKSRHIAESAENRLKEES